jgi:hypothetical protein
VRSQSGIKSDGRHTGNLSEMIEEPAEESNPKAKISEKLDSVKVQSEAVKSVQDIQES